MRTSTLAALAMLLVWAAPATGQKKPSFYTTHSSRSDRPAGPGEDSDAEAFAAWAESTTYGFLLDHLPCADVLSEDDARAMLGFERMKQLLGSSGDDDAIAAIAGAVGANYLIRAQAVQSGSNIAVTITVTNAGTATLVTKAIQVFPNDGETLDGIQNMAMEVAEEVAVPMRCPAWRGTVGWKFEFHQGGAKNGYPYTDDTVAEGTCVVDAWQGSEAVCQGRFSIVIKETCPSGKDCSESHEGEERDIPGYVSVEVTGGTIRISMGQFTVENDEGSKVTVFGFDIEKPLGDEQTSISGSETVSEPLPEDQDVTATVTRTWDLAIR